MYVEVTALSIAYTYLNEYLHAVWEIQVQQKS